MHYILCVVYVCVGYQVMSLSVFMAVGGVVLTDNTSLSMEDHVIIQKLVNVYNFGNDVHVFNLYYNLVVCSFFS